MGSRKTIFLTGAAGVVGAALLPVLRSYRVIALVHRAVPNGGEHLSGDLTSPNMGLTDSSYAELCCEIDAVVHSAAVTDFSQDRGLLERVNQDGTENVLQLCRRADVPLLYVSSAFIARQGKLNFAPGGSNEVDPSAYLATKDHAEELVRRSGVPSLIARLSVVIGDSQTGAIGRFQAIHAFASAVLRGQVPFVPGTANMQIDVIPQDIMATALLALLEHGFADGFHGGHYWLTGGDQSITIERFLRLIRDVGQASEIDVTLPRVMDEHMMARLIRPAFLDLVPKNARRHIDKLAALANLFLHSESFATSLGTFPGSPPVLTRSKIEAAFATSLQYLIRAKGLESPQQRKTAGMDHHAK